ncbi:MAG: heparan-alpha-glucosaminide N-acetyltransferase domain-containing protein [Chitinophagaceae bacterium]
MNQRFYSLDVFRGATVCLMILVNNPGSWNHIYPPLEHASWHGLTPTDLVFPFFLFAVGNAMAFVMPRLEAAGSAVFWRKVLRRSFLIFAIGLLINWWPFFHFTDTGLSFRHWVAPTDPDSGIRIMGVLQRIAICYLLASILVFYLKPTRTFVAGMIILLVYWAICLVANPTDPFSIEGWFGTSEVDLPLLGTAHLYKGEGIPFDPEGLASTLPSIVSVIFGYLAGDYIRKKGKNFEMLSGLFVTGVILMITGYCWDLVFPINKKIWTSSYTVYTSGLAFLTLATMIYLIEFRKAEGRITHFFDVFGKNALFVYALSAFLPETLGLIRLPDGESPWSVLYGQVYSKIPGDPRFGSLLFALTVIAFMWLLCYLMDRKKLYIRV